MVGDGTLFPRTTPKQIDTLADGEKILWIESGTRTCFVRTSQGMLYIVILLNYFSIVFMGK